MIPLLKDYLTGKKSWTITGLTLSFLINLTLWVYAIILVMKGSLTSVVIELGYLLLIPLTLFVGLHWNKRFRATRSGIEFLSDSNPWNDWEDV